MIANETLKVIKQRRSVRSFREERIKDKELQVIVEAGLYAPNAGNQAWHFTVVQNKDLLERLNSAAKEVARQMDFGNFKALGSDDNFHCLYNAPALIIVSGDGRIPIPLDADCAAATQNMLLAAESLGLGTCWIYFVMLAFQSPQGEDFRKELKIPDGYKPYNAAVVGYKRDEVVGAPERKPGLITYIK